MDKKIFIKGAIKSTDKQAGTFEVIASTDVLDREGERIDQSGWELDNYKKNPVILWGHDIFALPIGKATDIKVEDGSLIMSGEFASKEANPMAEQVRLLFDEGILKTVSVGFIPKEREGDTIIKAELLEVSFVPVPANPDALALAVSKNLDMRLFSSPSSKSSEDGQVVDGELKARLLKGKGENSYDKKSFYKVMRMKKSKKDEHTNDEVKEIVEGDLMDIASEIKSVILEVVDQAIPDLEEATEKQLEGTELMNELKKEIEEIVEKTIEAEVAPLADDIEDTVEEVVTEDGTKQDEVIAEVQEIVTLSFDAIAADIVEEVAKSVESVAGDIVGEMDEEKRQEGEEAVAEVIEVLEKNIETAVEQVLEKGLEPLVEDAAEAAESAVADKKSVKDICDPESEDYDPIACQAQEDAKAGHTDEDDEDEDDKKKKKEDEDDEDEDK